MNTQNLALQDRVGELFVTSFHTPVPDNEFLRWVESFRPSGVVVFAEHCVDHATLAASLGALRAQVEFPLLTAIDQEGGRVCRLRGTPAEYASAAVYGSRMDGLTGFQHDLGAAVRYMRELGLNWLLGPVCDLSAPASETALLGRTFSADPESVAAFVTAAVHTAHAAGMLTCLKHAPGLGHAVGDPHYKMAMTSATVDDIVTRERAPFRAGVDAGADAIMTSHFLIRDCGDTPITFSPDIIRSLVRLSGAEELPIVTDDLSMGALAAYGDPGEIVVRAFQAGHDILLARDPKIARLGAGALLKALAKGTLSEDRIAAALARVTILRERARSIASATANA